MKSGGPGCPYVNLLALQPFRFDHLRSSPIKETSRDGGSDHRPSTGQSLRGQDCNRYWRDQRPPSPQFPSPSPDLGFDSDRSSLSTASSMLSRCDRSDGSQHYWQGRQYHEDGAHMKINPLVFKDEDAKDMEEALKQYTTFTVGNLGFSKCDCMPFRLCNAPATYQRLLQNCLGELNLIYCLIYQDNLIMFLWTAEEHLHRLCIVFDQLREYNLKLKSSKCNLFKEEINYLAHWVPKQGVWPSDANLRAITECALPQTYTEICAFPGIRGHYQWFIKGFAWIAQPLNKHLAGQGASRKLDTLEAFQVLKQGCMSTPS